MSWGDCSRSAPWSLLTSMIVISDVLDFKSPDPALHGLCRSLSVVSAMTPTSPRLWDEECDDEVGLRVR